MKDFIKRIFNRKRKPKREPKPESENMVTVGEPESKSDEDQTAAVLRKYNQHLKKRVEEERKKFLEQQFPRTIETLAEWNGQSTGKPGAFAMDAGLSESLAVRDKLAADDAIMWRMREHFIGWASCALLMQNWLINRACTVPAEDAIAPGWKLAFSQDADGDGKEDSEEIQAANAAKLKEIEASADKMKIATVCKNANINKKAFGYSLVFPVFDRDIDMSEPFSIDRVPEGSYLGLKVIEPMWVTPQFDEEAIAPTSLSFYEPTWYMIAGRRKQRIHRSWCVKLVNSPVMDVSKPVYFYGGLPLTQQIFERVYAAEKVANEAPMLALTKRTLVLKANIENMIANPQMYEERMRAFAEDRNNYAVALVGENSDPQQFDVSLTDFAELISTQFQLVAAQAQIPVTKLLKVQIRGFDSSGEYEKDDYTQSLISIQNDDYAPIIDLHNRLFTKSTYGEVIEVSVKFNEIDTPSAKESAEIRLINAQRDAVLSTNGIISADEAREHLRRDENGEYTELAAEMPEDNLLDELNADGEEEANEPPAAGSNGKA